MKKNNAPLWGDCLRRHGEILIAMKLAVLLTFIGVINATASAYSQVGKVTLNVRDASITEVLDSIQKLTNYHFIYSLDLVSSERKVSIHADKEPLKDVLHALLDSQGVSFEVLPNYLIVVTPKGSLAPLAALSRVSHALEVEGSVKGDGGMPLTGVTVRVKGSSVGTVTDEDGRFRLNVPNPEDTLVLSYVGYTDLVVAIDGRTSLQLTMTASSEALKDVVVVGYGTQKKVSVTGAVDVIKPTLLEGRGVPNLAQALEGTSPSLVIQQKSFEPGQPVNLNLRGVGTLGDNSPLIVIDGLVGGDINKINPEDVASISILKDAGAAAIYGSRSANGVILITTKKGKAGPAKLSYSGIVSMVVPHFWVKPVPGYENMMLKDQALVNSGMEPIYSPLDIEHQQEKGDDQWFLDAIFKTSVQQNHNLSISGGSGQTTYRISGGYMNQQSNFVGPAKGVKRYDYRMNLSTVVGRLKLSTILAYTRQEIRDHSFNTGTLVVDAERTPPRYQLKDSLGRYLINDVLAQFNPLGILDKGGFRHYDNDNIFGTITGDLSLAKGLSLKGVFGGTLDANHQYYRTNYVPFYRPGAAVGSEPGGVYGNSLGTTTGDQNSKNILLNTQLLLQYQRTIGKSSFMVMGGITTESNSVAGNKVALDYTSQDLNLPNSNTIANVGSQQITPQGSNRSALNSYIGRATYSYADRYFGEIAFRADGSSKFSSNNRWGYFPSISAGWLISDEKFFREGNIANYVDELKLRSSYGVLGNQNVGNYQYQTTYFVFSNAYGFNNNSVAGTGFNTANPDLKWETAHTFNIGADVALFGSRLSGTFDYFNKLTTHIIQQPNLPGTYGGNNVDFNIASVRDRGWELSLSYRTHGRLFSHSISFNLGDTHNEIVKMANGRDLIQTHDEIQIIYAKGIPIASYVGLKRDGYFQNLDDIRNKPRFVGLDVQPGDISYKDKNGDGVIDDNDRYILGNPFPRFTFGFNYELGWNNFDLRVFIQGVGKRDMSLRGELVEPFHVNYSYVIFQHQLDYWRPDNPHAKNPRLGIVNSASNTNNYRKGSDLYIHSGAYARLKNLQIGYTLPQRVSDGMGLDHLRVYFTGQNIFTLARTKFVDPETTEFDNDLATGGSNSARNYPTLIYYGMGVDVTFK